MLTTGCHALDPLWYHPHPLDDMFGGAIGTSADGSRVGMVGLQLDLRPWPVPDPVDQ